MAKSKRQRYEQIRDEIERKIDDGSISKTDMHHIFEFLDAKDPECGVISDPNDTTKSDGTIARYAYSLKRIADLANFELTGCTDSDLNYFCDDMRHGRIDGVKDDGLTKGSVANYQKALRKFYEYHDDLGINKEDIILYSSESSPVDERDIFDKEDIHAIREAANHPRDRALVDILLYTGQRLSALLNLRLKDMKPSDGVFYLNGGANDQKGADGKRPLLYAEKAVRDWKHSHPCKNDPEAHFICQKSPNMGSNEYEVGQRIDNSTIYKVLQNIGDEAGVDKPMNAHNFRHTFVTICVRDYDMDFDTIKRIIGHAPDSNVMERVYTHLTDDDVINTAQKAAGIKDEEDESPLTPDICDNCGEPVPLDNAKACQSCGIIFTPDAAAVKESMSERLWNAKGEVETTTDDQAVDAIRELYEGNPEMIVQAIIEDSELTLESFTDIDS